jgi:hypothetical protein
MKIVKVTWEDSGTDNQVWVNKDDFADELGLCESVGFLVKKTNKVVVIAQSTSDTQYGNVLVIPRKMVRKVSDL